MDEKQLSKELIRDEGLRHDPYEDTVGKLTIGVGRNLDDKGISTEEAHLLLRNDIWDVVEDLDRELPWWVHLSDNRQRALANMCFNLGITRLLGFRKMFAAFERGDYYNAAYEATNSKWATQVGVRASRIEALIRQG